MIPCSRGSRGRDSNKTSLVDSKLSTTLALTLLLNASSVFAQELQVAQNLDEDFLNYLADMSIQDGKIIDQLDMLELENENIQGDNLERVVREINLNETPAKAQEINAKFKNEKLGSDEKEEQQ